MKSPSHTPGPWIVDIAAFSCYRSISTAARPPYEKIAEIPWAEPSVFDAERNANARLIAAAPELLAALENARLDLDYIVASLARKNTISISSVQNCAARARQAIAKAKGEAAS